MLIVVTAFCPSILVRKEKEVTFLQYKRKIKYNNRAIIGALYLYKFIYWSIAAFKDSTFKNADINEQMLYALGIVFFAFIGALPDVIILWLSNKLTFELWGDEDVNEKD
ncbi:MAG: hypothetical protein LBR10_00520 [Prevotellaceae bacterium]|jgi:hypothetical protein|nr:hypothetical protein [Prevotellaceae bacterium]